MKPHRRPGLRARGRLALGALALLAGCALPSLEKSGLASVQRQPAFELAQTPFFPQEDHQCGPAALATVLAASGATVDPETLVGQVYLPGREGSLQAELVAAARRHGRLAVRLAPSTEALLATVADGHPVLMLQNLGLPQAAAWHYAVLIGWDAPANRFILRSGREPRERLSSARFLQTWGLAERWAVVVVDPALPPPPSVSAAEWIAAAAPAEASGQAALAAQAYASAVQRWPTEPLAWIALANRRYADRDLPAAEQALARAVELDPQPAALNNLSQVRLERGCHEAARQTLERIGTPPEALAGAVADTRRQIEASAPGDAPGCSTTAAAPAPR